MKFISFKLILLLTIQIIFDLNLNFKEKLKFLKQIQKLRN